MALQAALHLSAKISNISKLSSVPNKEEKKDTFQRSTRICEDSEMFEAA
jgi:hypothetical protein